MNAVLAILGVTVAFIAGVACGTWTAIGIARKVMRELRGSSARNLAVLNAGFDEAMKWIPAHGAVAALAAIKRKEQETEQ